MIKTFLGFGLNFKLLIIFKTKLWVISISFNTFNLNISCGMMIKVSCILPVFNEEKLIANCLNSLIEQNFLNVEIIVVDDGSTDKTVSIVKEFIKKNKNIKLLHQKHNGPGLARNLGAKSAKGKILVFPDADEEFPKDYIKKLVSPIIKRKTVCTSPICGKLNTKSSIFSKIKFSEFNKKFGVESKGTKVYRAILKELFLKVDGFDNNDDYFDDSSLYKKIGKKPLLVNTFAYTTFSSNPIEFIFDSAWGVKSNINRGNKKPFFFGILLSIIIIVLIILIILFGPIFIVFTYLLIGIVGYCKTGLIEAFVFYQIVFVSKVIGLYLGIYRGLFSPDYKGK